MYSCRTWLLAVLLLLTSVAGAASLPFVVEDIRVEGLQRLPVDRVYAALGVSPGDEVNRDDVARATRALYETGDFQDVQLGRDGDELVVRVSERPSIASIDIAGNRSIDDQALMRGLEEAGLSEGEVFRRGTLEQLAGELERQYVAQGRYGASIDTEVTPLPRNRVALQINIEEGQPARIRDINIVGNEEFSDSELLANFELSRRTLWAAVRGRDKYTREQLSGDLERLRTHYLNRGYINFNVESTQVAVTPDRREVYITVNVDEGRQYEVGEVRLEGDLVVGEEQLRPLLMVRDGQIFNQQSVTRTNELLSRRLGNEGYLFARIDDHLDPDEETQKVDVIFHVDPGRRTYVRRINFRGNVTTRDEVLRREMRQFEGAPANSALIEMSRQRLMRLGFFALADVDTPRVPGEDDRVDVDFEVEEQPTGSIGANLGYSDASGLIFGANVSQQNWMGTGNRVSFSLNRSEVRETYRFSYFNPYYTLDGVSRGFSINYSEIDFDRARVSNYAANQFGASMNFGYPISEQSRLNFGFGYDHIDITGGDFVALDVAAFLADKAGKKPEDIADGGGAAFDLYKANASWRRSTLNRAVMATRGASQELGVEVALPGSDAEFYRFYWEGQRFFPITRRWLLRARADVGFGDGYGDNKVLPFFENFFAGGVGSVRGYRARTLGPRSPSVISPDEDFDDQDPIGGNLLTEGSLELIFPTPFAPESRNIRTFMFLDGGQVYQTTIDTGGRDFDFDADELRYSYGVGMTWLTAIGPLSFNFAQPINDEPEDDTETFQFSLGHVF